MAPQQGKDTTRKRRRADSHETLVISISSDSSDDSHFASFKKKKKMKTGNPQPNGTRFDQIDLNLPEEYPLSEVGENSHRVPFFCSGLLTAVSSEWGRSTARFNGENKWLQVPASIEELEDTASSKLATDERIDLNIPAEEVFLFNFDKLMEGLSQSEVGENSPGKPSCFPDGYDRQCFFSPVSDLAAAHSGVTAAHSAPSPDQSSSNSGDSDLASSDSSSDSELASSDSGDSHYASSDCYSDS